MNEQGKLSEFKQLFNELDNANVKPHNYNCYFYLVRFFFKNKAFETVHKMTRTILF